MLTWYIAVKSLHLHTYWWRGEIHIRVILQQTCGQQYSSCSEVFANHSVYIYLMRSRWKKTSSVMVENSPVHRPLLRIKTTQFPAHHTVTQEAVMKQAYLVPSDARRTSSDLMFLLTLEDTGTLMNTVTVMTWSSLPSNIHQAFLQEREKHP